MITYLLVASLLLIAVLELISRRDELRHLHITFEIDSELVEPGESVALRYTVHNTSRLPVLFSSLTLRLPGGVKVDEDVRWKKLHLSEDFTGQQVEHRFYLMPYGKFSGKTNIVIEKRGLHELGKWYLESGDLIGLSPFLRSGDISVKVICTAKSAEIDDIEALGGLIGDISVRRFIIDDPTLIMGYREYTGREAMKEISWLQTAKRNSLTVRKNDFTTDRIAVIALNMDEVNRADMERALSLTRAVCEMFESAKVPYSVRSNGDIDNIPEGLGRKHLFFIQRKIGLSKLAGHYSFGALIDRLSREKRGDVSVVIISPSSLDKYAAELQNLRRYLDREPIIIDGRETAQ